MEEEAHFTIDLNDPEDVSFWATQFEISEADLRAAVRAAGNNVEAVTKYLQQ